MLKKINFLIYIIIKMKTEDIEYNGQIFSCRKIIDISAMVELLGILAKRQKYLEDKLNFQEERINDKDKRISELEIMIKGVSLSKDEKFPSDKDFNPQIKQEIKNESDDDLYSFLNKDDKKEEKEKDNDLMEIKEEKKIEEEKQKENIEEKKEEIDEEKNEEKSEEKQEEKPVENEEEKSVKKDEEKIEEKKEIEKPEVNDNIENNNENENKNDNENNNKKEVENQVNINFEQNQSPTLLKKQNLAQNENIQPLDINNKEKTNENLNSSRYINNNSNIQTSRSQNKTVIPTPISSPAPATIDDEILKKIIKKLKLLESKIDKIQTQQDEIPSKPQTVVATPASDKTSKNKLEIKLNLLNNKIEQVEDAQNKMKEEMGKIKDKAEDFNVYDLLKNNTGDTNIDAAKGLIMNLENKVFKKFGFYDLKFKKNEEDIFNNKNDIKNLNNVLSNIKDICSKNTKDLNELKNKDDENFVEVNKFISEINNKIKDIDTKIEANPISNGNNIVDTNNNNIVFTNNISTNRNITTDASNNNINTRNNNNNNTNPNPNTSIPLTINNNDELIAKIRQIESAINDLKKKLESHNESNINENIQASPIIQEQVKVIKDITTRTEELEKNMKIILGQLNIKEVYERIETLEKDLMKKCSKFELTELKEKQNILEENEKDLNYKMDQMQQFNEKIRGDMQQFIKKIEYLSGQINRLTNENADMDKGKGSIIDITKLVDLNLFNEKQKEISKKFDKIRLSFEEVARNMDEILQKLSHMPNDKDFSQFQTIIKTMIEELKLNLNKKYSDKNETSKSIKFLETQIKSIQENLQKKVDGSDNWLLAKKPLNNYVCASCENIIRGELDKRSEFVPWNKYPNREEKSYRYGHGFSRMLQLINEDRKRELKEKDSMSDGGSDSEPMLKLPKLKRLHINSGKLKNNNAQSDDENNIPFDKQGSVNNNNDLNPLFDEERPKIMKIYKRNKNVAQSSYLNRLDKIKDKDTLANLIVKTLPNSPKEGIGKNEVINVQANEE